MSKQEILAELPKLSPEERREIAKTIFEMEEHVEILRECDRLADERFLILDGLEAEDAKTKSS
jgi:FlaA1/EpsC-like NDP-sugar epimerase